jgi:hypothetical protein
MELVHEFGCDGRHTRRQRCNVPWPDEAEAEAVASAAMPRRPLPPSPRMMISRRRKALALQLELAPLIAGLLILPSVMLISVARPWLVSVGWSVLLLLLMTFSLGGVGWLVVRMGWVACLSLTVRFLAVWASIILAFASLGTESTTPEGVWATALYIGSLVASAVSAVVLGRSIATDDRWRWS